MKARCLVGLVLVGFGVYACSSSDSAPAGTTPPAATTAPPGTTPPVATTPTATTPAPTIVGSTGGSVTANGIVLTIPAGALPSDTPISITPEGTIPAGYTGLSPLYTFSPDGTVFQVPVTIAFTLSNPGTEPTVYWSNPSGSYDALPTIVTATGVTASIQHFSQGFCAEKKQVIDDDDAGTPDSGPSDDDAGNDDAGNDDAGTPDSGSTQDSGSASDAGVSGITVTIDNVPTTFAANASVSTGTNTTTVKADDNATTTHWTLQITMVGAPQEECQPNGGPSMQYTHYTTGTIDAVYSSHSTSGACILLLTNTPTTAGQHATGEIISATLGETSGSMSSVSHSFASGTFDIIYSP